MGYSGNMVDEKIFKAYDIRGVIGKQFDASFAYNIGRAFVTFLKCKEVVIGRDARNSSPELFEHLRKGIMDQGANVIDIGLATTPMLYFAVGNYNYDAGIMITASHNPAEYNGFKFVMKGAIPIGGDNGMEDIKNLSVAGNFEDAPTGKLEEKEIMQDYTIHVLSFLGKIDEFKVVIDTANGMASFSLPKILEATPLKVIPLYYKIDMSFPNHEANPLKFETLKELQKQVLEYKAHLGIAFDGDADRVFFIDEKGEILSGDTTTGLVATEIVKEKPGSLILYDLRSSWVVKEEVEAIGGKAIMCRVGHAFIKRQMRTQGAEFAGELSGHFYYADNFFTESGVITMMKILELMTASKKPLSELAKPFRKYFKSGELNFEVENKQGVVDKIEKVFSKKTISHLDGVKVDNDDFWLNIRPSNTEPMLRLNVEAKTKEKLDNVLEQVKEIISQFSKSS